MIGAPIEGTAAHRDASTCGGGRQLTVVPAGDLADRYGDMDCGRTAPGTKSRKAPPAAATRTWPTGGSGYAAVYLHGPCAGR